MKFSFYKKNKFPFLIQLIILVFGFAWIYLNVFLQPFYIWTQGIVKPWLILNGSVLYRDIAWIRTPFDLFYLSFFHKLFGINNFAYQAAMFFLYVLIGFTIFFFLKRKSFLMAVISYLFYTVFIFPFFGNTEVGEILVSFFVLITFISITIFIENKKILFILFAGVASGFALITKQTSSFLIFAVLICIIFSSYKENHKLLDKRLIKRLGIYVLGVIIPLFFLLIYLYVNNALYFFLQYTIIYTLFEYPQMVPVSDFLEGMRIIGIYLSLIIPSIFIADNKNLAYKTKIFLIFLIVSLFPTLLPAFLSYRYVSAFPLFSIIAGFFIINLFKALAKNRKYLILATMVGGFLTFMLLSTYYFPYFEDLINSRFVRNQYILDYGDNEESIALWLKNNTNKKDKILDLANSIIMYKSERYPAIKFMESTPPYEHKMKAINGNPPKIIVVDTNLLRDDYKLIKKSGLYDYLFRNYFLKKKIDNMEVYFKKTGS